MSLKPSKYQKLIKHYIRVLDVKIHNFLCYFLEVLVTLTLAWDQFKDLEY